MQSPTDEIKARLDLVDFIGSHLPLTRAGANFKARCPFHQEKTPSFMVSKPKQMWYCFGCSEGGDIFKFVMKLEGLDFTEALKLLADKAGVILPRFDSRIQGQKNALLEIMKVAMEFYAAQLKAGSVGSGLIGDRGGAPSVGGQASPTLQGARLAWEYLRRRGITEVVIEKFGLGYAPDAWDTLALALRDKYKAEEVFTAGLFIRSERNQGFYDRFRHRIMFPIHDVHGNAVGFTSRILEAPTPGGVGAPTSPSANVGGKYVNTPETPIYSKGRVLYGLDLAREAIRRQDYAVLVEGNMDVIACHQFGMHNVVAASGTALTLDQVRMIKRYTSNLMIAFDADAAGAIAARRGIDIALAEGLRIKVITIPPGCGKDPDDCIRKSRKAWEGAVRGAQEIMEYYISQAQATYPITTASGRAKFVNTLLSESRKITDLVEQDFWVRRIAELARVDEKLLREQMGKLKLSPSGWKGLAEVNSLDALPAKLEIPRAERLSERLLAIFITSPKLAPTIIAGILPEMLMSDLLRELYTIMTVCYTAYNSTGSSPEGADFRHFWHNWLSDKRAENLSTAKPIDLQSVEERSAILELLGDKEFCEWEPRQFTKEVVFLIAQLRREHVKYRRHALATQMREAERAGNMAQVIVLTSEFKSLANDLDW